MLNVGDNSVGVSVKIGATTAYDAVGVGVDVRVGVGTAVVVNSRMYIVGSVDDMTISGALQIGARWVVRPEDD